MPTASESFWTNVVSWQALLALVAPHAPAPDKPKCSRPSTALSTVLRISFMQQWFGLSDPAMQGALHDAPLYREFSGIELVDDRLPSQNTILRFRHLLQKHDLFDQVLPSVN